MSERPGTLDHLVAEGLLGPEFLGRTRFDDLVAEREHRARMNATAEPGPNPEDAPGFFDDASDDAGDEEPPDFGPDLLLPTPAAIARLAGDWAANPDKGPPEIMHSIRTVHAFARLRLMTELPEDFEAPPSSEPTAHP